MAADAGFNFNDMTIRMGMNQRKGDGGGDGANEKDIFDFLFDTVGSQVISKTAKFTGTPNLDGLMNTGITKSFEMQGAHEKMINPMAQSFNAPGGVLYRLLSVFIKNSTITDHAGMHGTDMHLAGGGGGDYSGSGGGDYSGGGGGGGNYGDYAMSDMPAHYVGGAHIEPMTVEYGGRIYEVANMSAESLGYISPSAGTDIGAVRGKGDIELG